MFSAAVKADLIWLTLIGMMNSAIGAYYYLRIIVAMYMREPKHAVPVTRIPTGLGLALAITIAATIYLGVLPDRMLQYVQQSALSLTPQSPSTASIAHPQPGR